MIPPPTVRTLVIGALAGLTLGFFIGHHRSPVPAAVVVAHENSVHAESLVARVDTIVQTKTKTLTKTLAQYDTVRDSIKITDTLVVKEFVERCDALRQSCDDYIASAIRKFQADSDVFRAKNQEIAALLADRPSQFRQALKYLGVATVGYAAGRFSTGIHIPLP